MISFVMPARNGRELTQRTLQSLALVVQELNLGNVCEFVLLDDDSPAVDDIPGLFAQFRGSMACPVHCYRFRKHQHYSGSVAYGLSRARGENVIFVSNDMWVTPAHIRTLLAVAAIDESYGIVRGTGTIVDSHPEHSVPLVLPVRSMQQVSEHAEWVSRHMGLAHTEDSLLSLDCALIKRSVIKKVGTFDRAFFSYFGDVDFGLRVQRAGFRLVCAKGAWLYHDNAGYVRTEAEQAGTTMEAMHPKRMALVQKAYEIFRMRWDTSLPPTYPGTTGIDFAKLRGMKRPTGMDYVAPLGLEPELAVPV